MYKIREVAEILSVHERTVRRFMRERRIKGIRTGGLWRIPEDEIKRILGLQEDRKLGTGEKAQRM